MNFVILTNWNVINVIKRLFILMDHVLIIVLMAVIKMPIISANNVILDVHLAHLMNNVMSALIVPLSLVMIALVKQECCIKDNV